MKYLLIICTLLLGSVSGYAQSPTVVEAMKRDFHFVGEIYRNAYAPASWKKKHLGWDLDQAIQAGLNEIDSKSDLTVKDYHKILNRFFASTQDYHVGFDLNATEMATLPITFKNAEGRYFIAYIDREKLSEQAFPFSVGDELVKFNGRPIAEVIDELLVEIGPGVSETNNALATLLLTRRRASRAMDVPRGPVELAFVKQGNSQEVSHQLIWDYTPEEINYPNPAVSDLKMVPFSTSLRQKANPFERIKNAQMIFSGWKSLVDDDGDEEDAEPEVTQNPFAIGGKKSFVPTLGKVIWESGKDSLFHSYLYQNDEGQLIGYIRIPHYGGSKERFAEFKQTIKKFSEVTDALVIDQINNPGGHVFYLYALESVLTDQPLRTPLHHIKLTPSDVQEAAEALKQLANVKNDKDAQKALGEEWAGYPITLQTAEFLKEFAKFIINEWNAGNPFTQPTYLWGADRINPDKDVQYTKDIVVLVNELDFSGGDFFPAILQDNKRATILGVRTAGAGGYVNEARFPNMFGLQSFSFTGSLAMRVNDQPLENLGVVPDVKYQLTVTDLQKGFVGYKKVINKTIKDLIKQN